MKFDGSEQQRWEKTRQLLCSIRGVGGVCWEQFYSAPRPQQRAIRIRRCICGALGFRAGSQVLGAGQMQVTDGQISRQTCQIQDAVLPQCTAGPHERECTVIQKSAPVGLQQNMTEERLQGISPCVCRAGSEFLLVCPAREGSIHLGSPPGCVISLAEITLVSSLPYRRPAAARLSLRCPEHQGSAYTQLTKCHPSPKPSSCLPRWLSHLAGC